MPIYAQETQLWATMPQLNLLIVNLSIYAHNNGWFILPILAAVTQYLMTLSQPQPAACLLYTSSSLSVPGCGTCGAAGMAGTGRYSPVAKAPTSRCV